jgi:hypothetical protein
MERGGLFDNEEEYESEEDVKNDGWFKDNYIDLIEGHPREWIAVMDQTIIAVGATRIEVEDKAKAIAGERDYSVYYVNPTATVTDTGYAPR